VDVVEVPATHDHLLVDRVVVLRPALDLGVDPGGLELPGQLVGHLVQVGVPGRRPVGHQADDLVVLLRLQDGERQVLQLPLDRGHAEPVRQRGEHLQRLAGLLGLLLRRHEAHRAHVVQPVRELDHQHPGVFGHGDHHLANGLRLGRGAELHLVQLGDPVDELGDLLAEVRDEHLQRVVGVLDRVVQQRRDQRDGVHAELGEDRGDRERVGDVRVAGAAPLIAVHLLGHVVGPLQQREVGLGVQLAVHRRQRLEHLLDRCGALRGDPAGEALPNTPGRGRLPRDGRRCG
jgi:hypothetical protein